MSGSNIVTFCELGIGRMMLWGGAVFGTILSVLTVSIIILALKRSEDYGTLKAGVWSLLAGFVAGALIAMTIWLLYRNNSGFQKFVNKYQNSQQKSCDIIRENVE
jgi:predicted membrane chloride channel (bestrophin family)